MLIFRPHFVQRSLGPNLADGVYAHDADWNTFHSDIHVGAEGVAVSDVGGRGRFGVEVRWNVEGFGYLFLTADNAGEHYALPPEGETRRLNLNYELARSRVARNRRRYAQHAGDGWRPSRALQAYVDLSENYLEDAERAGDETRRAGLAQEALRFALEASEAMELEKARHAIARRGRRDDFFFGCDARSFYHMEANRFMDRFAELFDYATITFYTADETVGLSSFERQEGRRNFGTRDLILEQMEARGIAVEGRPLFWPHSFVTPDWLRGKSYGQLLSYVERHVREVVGYYGDRMYAWEVVNEMHDWANEVELNPDQLVEVTKLACDVAKDTAPNVHRLINNCCPFAEYVQDRKWTDRPAKYRQRTSRQFMRDLVDAGVDFTITGQQMYFPYRDLQDTIVMLEAFEAFGRPVQVTEVGASSGSTAEGVPLASFGLPTQEPYVWRRRWDEELQADWTEAIFTLAYSKPWIEACNWYDFLDGQCFIPGGGLVRSWKGERKPAFQRLSNLRQAWHGMEGRSSQRGG